MLPHAPYFPVLAYSDFFEFSEFKIMVAEKKFSANEEEEESPKKEAYFEAKHKSYNKNVNEKLEDRYNRGILLDGDYLI